MLSKLSKAYLARSIPNFPTNSLAKFLTEEKGLIKTKHRGFGDFISSFLFNN